MWKIAGSLDNVDGRTAFDGMRAGDDAASRVVENYVHYVACGLINVINIFQPEVLCIGGRYLQRGRDAAGADPGIHFPGAVQQILRPSDPSVRRRARQRRWCDRCRLSGLILPGICAR